MFRTQAFLNVSREFHMKEMKLLMKDTLIAHRNANKNARLPMNALYLHTNGIHGIAT